MDGVLVDSEPFICKAGCMMYAELGLQVRPEDFVPFVGMGENRFIGGVAEKYGAEIDVEAELTLAAEHGIDVFLYDWYWSMGVRTMEEALEHGFVSLEGCAETRLPAGNPRVFIRRAINVRMRLARFWRRDQARLAAIARGHIFIIHGSLPYCHLIPGRLSRRI